MSYEMKLLTIKIGWDHEVYLLTSDDDQSLEDYATKYLNEHFDEDLEFHEWKERECQTDDDGDPVAVDIMHLEPGLPLIIS